MVMDKMTTDTESWQNKKVMSFILGNISRLPGDYVEKVKVMEESFMNEYAEFNSEPQRAVMLTGSSAEGLSLDNIIHYATTFPGQDARMEEADLDVMMIDKRFLVVETNCHAESMTPFKLELKIEADLHPGYCQLAVEETKLRQCMKENSFNTKKPDNVLSCFKKGNNEDMYLSSQYYPQLMSVSIDQMRKLGAENVSRHGPAFSGEEMTATETELFDPKRNQSQGIINVMSSFDFVSCLKVEQWPKLADGWGKRPRKWPPRHIIDHILQSGSHVVAVASHTSKTPDIEWRLSFSYAEKVLAQEMTNLQRQIYIFVKYLLWKSFICKEKELPTYHLKTAFLWLLEDLDVTFWNEDNFSGAVFLLLEKISTSLTDRNYPNFFIPENNMIDHIECNVILELINNIEKVKTDMISFLITFPHENQPLILEKKVFHYVFKNIFPYLQMVDSDESMENFEQDKEVTLLKLAKAYQSFEVADFAVQIYTELWKNEEEEINLPDFITDLSIRGMEANCEALHEATKFHKYLLEHVFPENSDIMCTLAYLHLCISSVLQTHDAKEQIRSAEEYLSNVYDPDSFSHVLLKARIEIKKGEYIEAIKMLGDITKKVEEEIDMGYIVINAIEYELLHPKFVEVVKEFAQSKGTTFVPAAMFLQYTLADLLMIANEQEKFEAVCRNFEQLLQNSEIEKEDKQLGCHMLKVLQDGH